MKYKQYQKMKDSGVEWIGEIPEHWEINKIKFTSYVKGRIGWQGLTTREYIDEGPYLITGTDFQDGKINWKTCHHVEQWRYEQDPYIQIKNNDVLITKDGTIGKIAIVDDLPGDTTLNSGVMVVRPLNNHFIPKYLNWILNSSLFTDFINYIKSGTTINHLYQEEFGKFVFPIPEQDDQEQITKFLDNGTIVFDDLISKSQSHLNLLQEKRQTLINHAVTKGLDPTVTMKDSGIEWIGEIPEHWEVSKIKFVCDVRGRVGWKGYTVDDLVDEGALVIGAKHISNSKLDLSEPVYISWEKYYESPEIMVKKNDILLVQRGSLGNVVEIDNELGPTTINPSMILLTRFTEFPHFLWYQFNSDVIQTKVAQISQVTAVPMISQETVKNFRLIIPPKEEQKQIYDFLDKETTQFDDLISKTQSQINFLQEKRQALITAAVTGKIDVRNGVA